MAVSGFKAIAFEQAGTSKSINEIVRELHYHLVQIGLKHEIDSKRVSLPQQVNLLKDSEDGTDRLEMAKLEQDLVTAFSKHFESQISLGQLEAIESSENFPIQLADLFIGSVARILNKGSDSKLNHKDDLAEYITSLLKIDLSHKKHRDSCSEQEYKDSAFVHFL
ncbi:MAG: hypothetical protein ACFB4J_13635 [Elainellaceae cyanobacterium]